VAKLKIRFVLNKGRRGAPLGKLGRISEQVEKFLRALTTDCGISPKPGEWIAADFENHSVQFDAEFQGAVDTGIAQVFESKMEFLADFDPERDGFNGVIKESTALEYAKIGQMIDPDEEIGVGILPHRGGSPKWRSITYSKSETLKARVEFPIASFGSIQGIIHSWFKEVPVPYFNFRELSTSALVRVEYRQSQYESIAKAIQERNMVLMISGECYFDRVDRSVLKMRLERISETVNLSTSDFDQLFGAFAAFEQDVDWEEAL
jgi:hypothetical protein